MIIQAITTNRGKTLDRYTIYFWDGSCLTLSCNPDSPQGVSQFGESFGITDADFEEAALNKNHKIPDSDETLLNFFDLPAAIQSHIENRIMDAGK